ncbi:MAG: hypothetical protein LBH94_01460 [Deltaproteobacteria bacterium]|nr:hypothetical protein [Deltaproteobacteria bacterium]
MKRLLTHCAALCLLLCACGPALLGQDDPELWAPKDGQLDIALACAADMALAGEGAAGETNALPNEFKGSQAAQASLNKLDDDMTNSWQGREALYALTVGTSFQWRGQQARNVRVNMQRADGAKEWSGLAVRDSRKVWTFIDRVQRWSNADTLAFYKGIDRPGDGLTHRWKGDAGLCGLTVLDTDIKGNFVYRNFSLKIGGVTVQGSVSRQEKHPWRLESAR